MDILFSKIKKIKIEGDKYYLTYPFRYPSFVDKYGDDEVVNIILYVSLLLLENLERGIFYKIKLDPNYSFKIIRQDEETEINILGRVLTTRFHPVLNYLVSVYDPRVTKHDDYYYNTIVNEKYSSCKQVIMNNILDLIKNLDIDILKVCTHSTNIEQLIDILYFYSKSGRYNIRDEIKKTKEFFNNNSTLKDKLDIDFNNITTFEDLVEHYKIYDDKMLFKLLIRWQYYNDGSINKHIFKKFKEELLSGKMTYDDFYKKRTNIKYLGKLFK